MGELEAIPVAVCAVVGAMFALHEARAIVMGLPSSIFNGALAGLLMGVAAWLAG